MELSEEQLLLLSIPRSIHVTKEKSIERLDTKNMNKKDKKGKKPLKKKSYIVIWFRETYPNSPVRKTEQEYSGEANEVLVAAQQQLLQTFQESLILGLNAIFHHQRFSKKSSVLKEASQPLLHFWMVS